jgi:hypothetical protein
MTRSTCFSVTLIRYECCLTSHFLTSDETTLRQPLDSHNGLTEPSPLKASSLSQSPNSARESCQRSVGIQAWHQPSLPMHAAQESAGCAVSEE